MLVAKVTFVLGLLVYGGGCKKRGEEISREKTSIEKRAAAAPPKPAVPADCSKTVGGEGGNAKQIFTQLIHAIERRLYSKELAINQFGFLYMHGKTYGVQYDDPNVSKVMQWTKPLPGKGKQLPGLGKPPPDSSPLPNKIIWPAKGKTINFQFAQPTPAAIGRPGNIGHSEEQLLNSFEIMADNFIAKHGNECPCYVILGTKIYPCYNSGDQTGCAQYYVNVKQAFQKDKCPSTKFYLIYGRAGTPPVQAVLTGNGIATFSYP